MNDTTGYQIILNVLISPEMFQQATKAVASRKFSHCLFSCPHLDLQCSNY